jgi:hypothetical protein
VLCEFAVLLFLSGVPNSANAFYEAENSEFKLETTGLLRGFGIGLQNPDNSVFYQIHNAVGAGMFVRGMLAASWQDVLSLEIHAEHSYFSSVLQSGGSRFPPQPGVERSDIFTWSNLNRQAVLQFDWFNLQYKGKGMTFKLGRQPLNLAATFFFTPNDFFSPFAAQTFFRNYKSGVDAARLDVQLSEFSQLSLISVLGYRLDNRTDSGWSVTPALDRTSYLARFSAVVDTFEWALLAGRVRKNPLVGVDFQGELFDWLGIRGEGHVAFPQQSAQKIDVEFALSLEHRFENTLTLRLEQFYHGSGTDDAAQYSAKLLERTAQQSSPYLAQNFIPHSE